jgi:hypothetical protein
VELELPNLVQKHRDPLAKLRAEGIKEREDTTLANWRRVAVAWKQSGAEAVQEDEEEWRGGLL